MDLGSIPKFPEWLIRLLLICTAIGFLCVAALLCGGIYGALRWWFTR